MTLAPAGGAPGVFVVPPEPVRELTGVGRDVAAFLGVAPRGPAWLPPETLEPDVDVARWLATERRRRSIAVPVTSWDEYRRRFGGFEGPGRLPYAVSTFFSQGGVRAYVVRIVHTHADRRADADGRASGRLKLRHRPVLTDAGTPVRLFARSEGRWGDNLRASMEFATRPLAGTVGGPARLDVGRREWVPGGSLVRLTSAAGARQLCFVESSVEVADPAGPGATRLLTLEVPMAFVPQRLELVTATLEVVDRDSTYPRRERIEGIGLRPDHPRWLARVLVLESTLCWPGPKWAGASIRLPDPGLPTLGLEGRRRARHMTGGRDLWDAIVPEDFHDDRWVPGDEDPGDGVQCLGDLEDVGLVVAADLYDPAPLVPEDVVTDPPTLCGPDFAVHVGSPPVPPPEAPPAPGLTGLALDPRVPADLDRVVANQQALAAYAVLRRDHTLCLDVPLGLTHREMLAWRDAFDSPYVAAYHPWLDIASVEDRRDGLVRLNPSAFGAGIVAERERRLGVQYGAANEIAVGAVRPAELVPPDRHDELHVNGINVFRTERDGIRLWGARTTSRDASLRQLSVARLMTILRLTLEREMLWAVFEPNNPELWSEVRRMVTALLTRLFEAGAFAGATTSEAFFVRCDRSTMTLNDLDSGRLVCLVGVAPTEPLEYLVVEIALAATEGISVDVRG